MQGGHLRSFVNQVWGYADPENAEVLSVHQLASLIDCLDKKLYGYGKIAIQAPSVFGQNRTTGYRQDFEDQMKSQLDKFELIVSAYQRRSDSAALTSATSIAAGIQPRTTGTAARGASSSSSQTTVAVPSSPVPFTSLFNNASTLTGTASPDLTLSGLPGVGLANAAASAKQGIGLEPTVALDERANYLYHLNELRRVNAGDDSSDLPGYGLYLIRMPVSLLPSRESIKGKGASVTVKAKHNLTPDVLPNTFQNVVVLDTAYSLMDVIIRGQFFLIVDPTCKSVTATPEPRAVAPPPRFGARAVPSGAQTAGSSHGAFGNAPSTEVVQVFGADNLDILVQAMQSDQVTWYRHDPSVVSWLLTELSSAYGYMRDQAHRNNPLFKPAVFEQVAALVLQRQYDRLKTYREQWITNLRIGRGVYKGAGNDCPEPIDVLSFALMVQSVYLDRQIKADMQVMAQAKIAVVAILGI